MVNRAEVIADFNKVYTDLENSVQLFNDKIFNAVPFKDSWTPGQVVQHLILSNGGFAEVLYAEVSATDRPIDEHKEQLKAIFLNFETKMKSPDFILPELKEYNKDRHLLKMGEIKQGILKAISELDLTETCVSFALPGLGNLTRYEAVYFVIYHTERHVHQLNEIYRFLQMA